MTPRFHEGEKVKYPQYRPLIRATWNQAVTDCLNSGFIGPGKGVEVFEDALRRKYDFEHLMTVNSGTTALMLAVQALTRPGDIVVCPSYGFLAGHNAVALSGRKVELSPVNYDGVMDAKLLDIVLQNTQASCVLFINHNAYNDSDKILELRNIAYKYGCTFLEDSSQCINVHYTDEWKQGYCGTIGDIGILSFSVPKLLTTGQGGAIITSNPRYAKRIEQLRDHGGGEWRKTRIHEAIGGNFRLTDMQAAYGLAQLTEIESLYQRRSEIHQTYRKYLGNRYLSHDHSWMCVAQDQLRFTATTEQLKQDSIETKQYYYPINRNIPYQDLSFCKVASDIYQRHLFLPSSLDLEESDIKFISEKFLACE